MADLASIRGAAAEALHAAGALDDGWRLDSVRRRDPRCVDVVLRPEEPDAPGLCVEWVQPEPGGSAPAFRRGPRYAASYRRGPGLYDVDLPETPEAARRRAHLACEALAALESGPSLVARAATRAPRREGGWTAETLAEDLAAGLAEDLGTEALPNPEAWEVEEVRVFQRWERVAEVLLRRPDRTLAFIVYPTDADRPAFSRSANLDCVYYSDDLAVSEHAALYARDRVTIEAVAAWLRAWDGDPA